MEATHEQWLKQYYPVAAVLHEIKNYPHEQRDFVRNLSQDFSHHYGKFPGAQTMASDIPPPQTEVNGVGEKM